PRRRQQLARRAQAIALQLEPLVLARLQRRVDQLLELKLQELLALGPRALVERRRRQRLAGGLDAPVRRRHLVEPMPAERVEDGEVMCRIAERLVLVLPRQL